MSRVPALFVSEAFHYFDSSLSIETVTRGKNVEDCAAEITEIWDADTHMIVCYRCADDFGDTFESDDPVSITFRKTLILSGNLGIEWMCEDCGKMVGEMDENTDAYVYVHVMP